MLARSRLTPDPWRLAYEVKWDGFRAIVSTEDRFRVRSGRGWDMTRLVPEFNQDQEPHIPANGTRVGDLYDAYVSSFRRVASLPRRRVGGTRFVFDRDGSTGRHDQSSLAMR